MNAIEKAKEIRRASESPYFVRAKVDDLIAEMEAEKPAEDAMAVAGDIGALCIYSGWEGHAYEQGKAAQMIQSYAESYHAKKCAECKNVEPRKYYPLGQEPMSSDGSEHGYEENDE